MSNFESIDGEDAWDEEFADSLVGCTLLAGLTYVEHDDQLIRRQQVCGTVMSADRRSGIVIRQDTGEDVTIAPILDAIEPAQPGIYQLADEDAEVENLDFTVLLTIRSPFVARVQRASPAAAETGLVAPRSYSHGRSTEATGSLQRPPFLTMANPG